MTLKRDGSEWVQLHPSVRPKVRDAFNALAEHYDMNQRLMISKLVNDEVERLRKRGVKLDTPSA